jgi:DNA repair protein SbcC/Rad50
MFWRGKKMIEYDYTLSVDVGTSLQTFKPLKEIPTNMKNIVKIQGPNSSGKSTLLNIIALGYHGFYSDTIPASIKERINDLQESDYKDLEFKILIRDPVTGTLLKTEKIKNLRDVVVKESLNDGPFNVIAPDTFSKKYRLIYDIPENPIGRLQEISKEISVLQNHYLESVKKFQRYIEEISKEIRALKTNEDPEKIETAYLQYKKKYDSIDPERLVIDIDNMKKLYFAFRVKEADEDVKKKEAEYRPSKTLAESASNNFQKGNYNESHSTYMSVAASANKAVCQVVILIDKINDTKLNNYRTKLEDCDFTKYFDDRKIPETISHTISNLNGLAKSFEDQKSPQNELISELINVLKKYEQTDITLASLGSVNQVIGILDKEFSKNKDRSLIQNYANLKKWCNDLNKYHNDLKKILVNLVEDNESDSSRISIAIRLRNEYEFAQNKRQKLITEESSKYGVSLVNYSKVISDLANEVKIHVTSSVDAKVHVEDLEFQYNRDKNEKQENGKLMKEAESKLDKIRNIKKCKYFENSEDISRIINEASTLASRLNESNRKMNAISDKNYGHYDKDDVYFSSVWVYLAKRIKYVQHLNTNYELDRVNIIEDIIYSKDGTIIRMKDMGTGQSQLSYLLGLLSADDDRKIIALFDEVATMTGSTLQSLFDRFENLQMEGRLMLGMTVMPSEKIEVDEYGL